MLDQHHPSTYYAKLYSGAKRYIRKHPRLVRLVRVVRYIGRLGPWRSLIMEYVQGYVPNPPLRTSENTLFPTLDTDHVVDKITRLGYSLGTSLPEEYVDNICDYCEDKEFATFNNPHRDCKLVNNIAYDRTIVEIVRRYLEAEPILYGTEIYWSRPKAYSKELQSLDVKRRDFHYDVGDFKSLTLFIYLTDVDFDCGPHVLIENTRVKTLKELLNPLISYEVAIKKYGSRIKIITGRRGTSFFEDLTNYHQRSIGQKPRVILTISYTFHRKPK